MSASIRNLVRTPSWPARAGWAVLNALQLVFTLALTSGGIVIALLVRLLMRGERVPLRWARQWWAPALLTGAGARLEVVGADRVDWSRPCILVANHQSIIDICALFRAVPVPLRFVLKHEMLKVPFVGRYARAMGMVFIERGARRSVARSLAEAVERVRGGATVCVFPEGTRSRDGRVAPFKPGAFEVALAAGVAVVPVGITGTGAVLPASGFRVRPGAIRVRFGEPLSMPPRDEADARGRLAAQARDAVVELMRAGP